jgi:hypothetical protein
MWDAFAANNDVNAPKIIKNPLQPADAKQTLEANVTLAKAGNEPPQFHGFRLGPGDNHSADLVMFVPSAKLSKIASIRLTLRSMESIERKTLIDIRRTLPQVTSTAAASTKNAH